MSAKGELPSQPHKETTSLAELSRRYLKGELGLEDYLAQERHLTPRFGEVGLASKMILRKVKQGK
jgi:hypothetical protein